MARISKQRQMFICGLCVLFALVCTFCLFLSHDHECEGVQCRVCALFDTYEQLWMPVVVAALFSDAAFVLSDALLTAEGCPEKSLVRLKVKLSN